MTLTPEERTKIYEEEKARIEGTPPSQNERSLKDMKPGTAALLSYLGGWITGIVFLVLEQKDRFIRFNALQSIILFGFLNIVYAMFHGIPFIGPFFGAIVFVVGLVLWIVLMVKAGQEQYFVVPGAGDLAWRILGQSPPAASGPSAGQTGGASQPVTGTPSSEPVSRPHETRVVGRGRAGRVVGSSFAIASCVVLLIFLNFFNSYVAFYHQEGAIWFRDPILTSSLSTWLPVVNTVLILTALGHVLLLALDNFILREGVLTIFDVFSIVAVSSLFVIFPFDFSPFGSGMVAPLELGVRLTLGFVVFGLCIGIIARLVRLIVKLVRGTATF